MLLHGQEIGQNLGRVKPVGEAIVDRHAGISGQLFDRGLGETLVFDGVRPGPIPARYPSSILWRSI